MKELSIEEKAKRYEEAIKRAKGAHNSAKSDKENGVIDKITEYTIQLTETIFPELKESEDEKMWKLIKKYAHYNISDSALEADYITREHLESWLEKQSEHNYTWKPSDKQMDALNIAIGEANTVDTAAGDEAAEILTSLYKELKKLRKD